MPQPVPWVERDDPVDALGVLGDRVLRCAATMRLATVAEQLTVVRTPT